jgi:hypothetical protein
MVRSCALLHENVLHPAILSTRLARTAGKAEMTLRSTASPAQRSAQRGRTAFGDGSSEADIHRDQVSFYLTQS